MKYNVVYEKTLYYSIPVEAEDTSEAFVKAEQQLVEKGAEAFYWCASKLEYSETEHDD